MKTEVNIKTYQIIKRNYSSLERIEESRSVVYELSGNRYSNLCNYHNVKRCLKNDFDGLTFLLCRHKYDFMRINESMLDTASLDKQLSLIEEFSKENEVEFFFKWEITSKEIKKTRARYSILFGHIDLAFKVFTPYANEVIYLYGDCMESLVENMYNCKKQISLIKSYIPRRVINLHVSNILFSETASGILMHEAIGHIAESDLTLSRKSILNVFKNKLLISNDELTVIDDGDADGTGWTPVDDEGSLARPTKIVENGIIQNLLYNNLTARTDNTTSTGNARLLFPDGIPLVRMTNTMVEKGTSNLENLFQSNEEFIFIDTFSTCFGYNKLYLNPSRAYLIKNDIWTPVKIKPFISTSEMILRGISKIGNKRKSIKSTVTGCKKKNDYILPVGIMSPMLYYKNAHIVL